MRSLIFAILSVCLLSLKLSADQVEYWNLKPFNREEINGGKYNGYKAIFLTSQVHRLQLSIKGSDQEGLTAWAQLEEPLSLSFGQPLTLYINRLSPHDGYIEFEGAKMACKMEWAAPEKEDYDILELGYPVLTDPFIISGQTYWAYQGKIVRNDYSYDAERCYDYGYDLVRVCTQIQSVDLELRLENETPIPPWHYHWSDKVIVYSERKVDQVNVVKNAFMNMCKHWEATDVIIILIHENYPGYRWIVNATRGGEAFFCKGAETVDLVSNVWNKMSS